MSPPRSLRGLLVVALVVLGPGWTATDVWAQPDADRSGGVRLELTALDGVRGPGSGPTVTPGSVPEGIGDSGGNRDVGLRLLVENTGDRPFDALRVVVEFHPSVEGRGELESALAGRMSSAPSLVRGVDVDDGAELAPGGIAGVELELPGEVPFAPMHGVHPLRITLLRGTTVIDEIVTAIVWFGERPVEPVGLALIWPFDAAPWRGAGGTYPEGADREVQPGGRLDRLLTAAEGASDTLLNLAPAAHLLEDLADRAGGFRRTVRNVDGVLEGEDVAADQPEALLASRTLRRLRALTAEQRAAPVTGTYADVDLISLVAHGDEAARLASSAAIAARRRLPGELGRDIDPAVHLADDRLAASVLDLIGGDTVVLDAVAAGLPDVRDAAVTDADLGAVVRPLIAPSGRQFSAIIPDPYLAAAFADGPRSGGPLVTAQNLLARTAILHNVDHGRADRALVLRPPATWSPSPTAAAVLLHGLDEASWLESRSISELAAGARRGTDPVELALAPGQGELDTSDPSAVIDPRLVADMESASTGIDALVAGLPDPANRVEGRTIDELRDDLLRAGSRWLVGTGEAEALVRDVQRSVDTRRGDIEVTTGTVTLTSDTGQIPVTLQRSRGDPIRVVVTVESQGRLLWPEGRRSEELLLETEGASQTVSFTTRALSTGTFPVTVRVTDPGGLVTMTETIVSVRSTAISGPALIATGALVAILLLIGALRRRGGSPHGSGRRRGDDDQSLQALPTP